MVFHKSYRDAVLTIIDGAAAEVEVGIAEGDLNIKIAREVNVILDRGVLHEVKLADETPIEFTFSYKLDGFESPAILTPYELFTKTGGASAITGTRDGSTNVHTVNLQWELLDSAGSTEETVLLNHCFFTGIDVSEAMPTGMVVISGRSFSILPVIS